MIIPGGGKFEGMASTFHPTARGAIPRPNREFVSMARDDAKSDRGKGKSDFPTRKIITTPIRLSYPFLFDARENDQGAEYWETEALIPPNREGDALRAQIIEALTEVMEEAFGPEDEWPRGRNDYHPADKLKHADPDKLPGPGINADWTIFRARSYQPVGVVDIDKNEVLNKREVYGGRWARLSITAAAYDSKKSKGVTIYLNNVQLLDHDESFGGRPSADQDFDRWDGEELAPGGRRERDRDERGGGGRRGRDDRDDRASGEGRRSGRGEGDRARADGRGADRAGAREARDEGRSDRSGSRVRGDSVRVDERAPGGRARDQDRRGDDRVQDRDRREDRDRGGRSDSRDGGRAGGRDESRRGRDRDEDRGRDRDDGDADTREDRRSARDNRDDDRRGGRGREREDDREDEDRRPSDRGRGRDDEGEDWS